jgi:hypothetical protein
MTSLAALIPVLARPQNVAPLVESFDASVATERAAGWDVWLTFVCSPGDDAELAEVRAHGFDPLIVDGGYAKKINRGPSYAPADWYLTGADDLRFHEGWLTAAMRRHTKTGAHVIGTNDLHNPAVVRGLYATHLLVHRDYMARGTIDEPGKILHEGYHHNCPDTELVETAKVRGEYAFARDSHVEHLHPIFKGAPDDSTYRLGRKHHAMDKVLLRERRKLWTRTSGERRRLHSAASRR